LVSINRTSAIICILLSLTFISCNSPDESEAVVTTDFESKESTVQSIHKLFNQQEFEILYQQASKSAQNSFEKKQFLSFVEYLRRTLGEVQNAEIANEMETESGQTAVILNVEYQNDRGTERWILEKVGGQWHWTEFNYNAESIMKGN
jgi:hypothetical protein